MWGKDTEREKWERERIIAKGNDGEIEKVNSVCCGGIKWEQMEKKGKSRKNSKQLGEGKEEREREILTGSPLRKVCSLQ